MARKRICSGCGKRAEFPVIVTCKKNDKKMCKDCCVKTLEGIGECVHWGFCWPSYYI
ncbi:MAG: hypothetical protein KAT94_01030 [Candidatus Aenigmarchaeota archaeon]|nr:hypothetical protein [Candidatus Aenigmarchaeota archaeon]MCK4531427.1 hypothetical protein [Candidatus Aenigmarchaeota archaeon]